MNTVVIDSFIESAASSSFTKAAAVLYTSQQSVSRNVALLEEELGVSLFQRTRDGLMLTDAGRYYLPLFQSLKYVGECAHERMRDEKKRRDREIAIGCSTEVNPYGTLLDAIRAYRAEHPELQISLRVYNNEELLEKLESRTLDIALISGIDHPSSAAVEALPICPQEIRIYGPAKYFSAEAQNCRKGAVIAHVSSWKRSSAEETVRLRQILSQTDLEQCSVRMLPNISSLVIAMQHDDMLTVSDARFGFLNDIQGLDSEKLAVRSDLLACMPAGSENRNARALCAYLREATQNF